jgi:hypothetical protein
MTKKLLKITQPALADDPIVIDPRDGITPEEISAAARILQQGEQPAPEVDPEMTPGVSTETPEDDPEPEPSPEPDPAPEPEAQPALSEAEAEPTVEEAVSAVAGPLPGSCINCGENSSDALSITTAGYACRTCGHVWTDAEEHAPFRRIARGA